MSSAHGGDDGQMIRGAARMTRAGPPIANPHATLRAAAGESCAP